MRPRTDLLARLVLVASMAVTACGPPSPEEVRLRTVENGAPRSAAPPSKIQEGDLFVVDADPHDGDESMDLCVDASTSGTTSAVRVARVTGSCRRFAVVAQAAGRVEIRFSARETASILVLDVSPAQ